MPFKDALGRKPGEALDSLRYNEMQLNIRAIASPRLFSAVWQQNPRTTGGMIINPSWFLIVERSQLPEGIRWVRAYDLAFSEKQIGKANPDYTVGSKVGYLYDKINNSYKFYVDDLQRWRMQWPDTKKRILKIAEKDGKNVIIIVEGGGPQKGLGDSMKEEKEFKNYRIVTETPIKDKVARAQYWADEAEVGKIFLVNGEWIKPFLDECEIFNNGTHDDQIDALSLAFWHLSKAYKHSDVTFIKVKGLYK